MNSGILIPLLVGLLGLLIGYLFGKVSTRSSTSKAEVEHWRNKNAQLEADLIKCRLKLASATTKKTSKAKITLASSETKPIEFNSLAAKEVYGKTIKKDDLNVVEGIGPKIKNLFHQHNINTWKTLAETSIEQCNDVLRNGGERFIVHNPGTWPRQAKMAYEGKWKQLKAWQDTLDKGKE